nr:helix-turn-helix domain-containing protein [Burkholderiaceae bacterium]
GAVARNAKALALLDHLLLHPTVSIKRVAHHLGCTQPTAAKLVASLESHGWLRELTGYGRNRVWRYQPYVDLFHRDALNALVPAQPAAGEPSTA